MRRLLIVSFDILRPRDPRPSYSIASILAYARAHELRASGRLEVIHEPINLFENQPFTGATAAAQVAEHHDLRGLAFVAISVYVWCETLISGFMEELRRLGFTGDFVLGGYQITAEALATLPDLYPQAQYFVKGYAEAGLLRIAAGGQDCPRVVDDRPAVDTLPSPFLTGVIRVEPSQEIEMLRWETKRGCPHQCGFCEWGKANAGCVDEFSLSRIKAELELFKKAKIEKVNVLDPTFNCGRSYLEVARLMTEVPTVFAVQARFEGLETPAGREFLDLCSGGSIHLELGLQTVVPQEMTAIGRRNDMEAVRRVMAALDAKRIRYEISLIYGIPGQTVSSFLESVNFVLRNGCTTVKCFPLRIPKNSDMERFALLQGARQEDPGKNYSIAQVVSSFSFEAEDWKSMKAVADLLSEKKPGSFIVQERAGLSWRVARVCQTLEIGALPDGSDLTPRNPSNVPSVPLSGAVCGPFFSRIDGSLRRIRIRRVCDDAIVWMQE